MNINVRKTAKMSAYFLFLFFYFFIFMYLTTFLPHCWHLTRGVGKGLIMVKQSQSQSSFGDVWCWCSSLWWWWCWCWRYLKRPESDSLAAKDRVDQNSWCCCFRMSSSSGKSRWHFCRLPAVTRSNLACYLLKAGDEGNLKPSNTKSNCANASVCVCVCVCVFQSK